MLRIIPAFYFKFAAAAFCAAGLLAVSGCGAHHYEHHAHHGLKSTSENDRVRIADAVNELFVATDEKDWSRVRAVFADRVDFDVTSLVGGESAVLPAGQIVDGWREGLKDVPVVHHQVGNMRIAVRGDEAEVFCYGMATHYNPAAEKRVTWFVGSYDLRLSRVGGDWKISAFRFNSKYVE